MSDNKTLVLDAVVPTISSVSSTISNGYFVVDDVIPIKITFSEAVNVVGTPQLTLETGASDAGELHKRHGHQRTYLQLYRCFWSY